MRKEELSKMLRVGGRRGRKREEKKCKGTAVRDTHTHTHGRQAGSLKKKGKKKEKKMTCVDVLKLFLAGGARKRVGGEGGGRR